jgi:hypothetical protein
MLAAWTEVLPLFVVRWLSNRRCERIAMQSELFHQARPDCLFWIPTRVEEKKR